ncbi:hypothetical protein FOZ63_019101, partial [Perkinsus olseni]
YIAGGSETTASAMSWLLSNFCLHPEIQQRARREADSLEELSVDSIHSMPFIEACALESVRLKPSAPISFTKALVDCEVAGKPIEAGTRLIFPIGQMMRESYEDGDKFMWVTGPMAIAMMAAHVFTMMVTRGDTIVFQRLNSNPMVRPERWLTPSGDSIDEEKRLELIAFGFGPRQCPG